VKRIETLRTVRQQLMEKFRAQGMIEGDAAMATIDEMRRLGFYPKPTTIEATPLGARRSSSSAATSATGTSTTARP
jgi:hypothetical protein